MIYKWSRTLPIAPLYPYTQKTIHFLESIDCLNINKKKRAENSFSLNFNTAELVVKIYLIGYGICDALRQLLRTRCLRRHLKQAGANVRACMREANATMNPFAKESPSSPLVGHERATTNQSYHGPINSATQSKFVNPSFVLNSIPCLHRKQNIWV